MCSCYVMPCMHSSPAVSSRIRKKVEKKKFYFKDVSYAFAMALNLRKKC